MARIFSVVLPKSDAGLIFAGKKFQSDHWCPIYEVKNGLCNRGYGWQSGSPGDARKDLRRRERSSFCLAVCCSIRAYYFH